MEFASELVRQIVEALQSRADVTALTLFGSHARETALGGADEYSDVDLQVVARDEDKILSAEWVTDLVGREHLKVWSVRDAFGEVKKISIILSDGELDLVVIPHRRMRLARWVVSVGWHRRSKSAQRQLGDLVIVAADGYRVLKGGEMWERFWNRILAEIPVPHLTMEDVESLWARAQVEHRSIMRKLDRGELIASQRWLHTELGETNFRLLHELKRKNGEVSFYDARRVEFVYAPKELEWIRVSAEPKTETIRRAADHALQSARELVARLRA